MLRIAALASSVVASMPTVRPTTSVASASRCNTHVARSERTHAAVESRAVVADAGGEVVVDVDGVDARGLQRVALQVQRLGAVRL